MVRSEDDEEEDEEELRDFEELYAAERRAGLHSVKALDAFNQRIEVLRREGIARGGMHCCGTTGKWHNAWCWTGQTKPEES